MSATADYPAGKALSNRRLTPEQSRRLNRRLRKFCAAGMPGTQIHQMINAEMGLDLRFQTIFKRVQNLGLRWTFTPRTGRSRPDTEYLPEEQRAACYADPAWEARNGIADQVICRECFAVFRDGAMDGKNGHLWLIHRDLLGCESPEEVRPCYRRRNPGAPLFTSQRIAKQQRVRVSKLMTAEAELYVTPEELAAADTDPDYEEHNGIKKYVICREPRCGFKSVESLTKHLRSQHGKTVVQYRREHKLPRITAQDAASDQAKRERRRILVLRTAAQSEAPKAIRHRKPRGQVGAPAKRTPAYLEEANALYAQLGSWGKVAKKLIYSEWEGDQKGSADRLRLDVKYYLSHRKPRANPTARKS